VDVADFDYELPPDLIAHFDDVIRQHVARK